MQGPCHLCNNTPLSKASKVRLQYAVHVFIQGVVGHLWEDLPMPYASLFVAMPISMYFQDVMDRSMSSTWSLLPGDYLARAYHQQKCNLTNNKLLYIYMHISYQRNMRISPVARGAIRFSNNWCKGYTVEEILEYIHIVKYGKYTVLYINITHTSVIFHVILWSYSMTYTYVYIYM